MGMVVSISSCVVELIHRAAKAAAPDEACGLLFGTSKRIDRASIAANVAGDPRRHFEIDPVVLFAALKAERAGGERIAGYWHSHPSGDTHPSPTDAAMAVADGRLWLIAGGGEIALWRAVEAGAVHDRFDPVALTII
jgi:desampylase